MHEAIAKLGVPENGTVLEPGCGTGNFLSMAPASMQCIGIELDGISARIAKARFPHQDIRNEDFADTRLPSLSGVIGNVPFADVKLNYQGEKLALHDYFIAKSLDALSPGGVMAIVTTHFTLDKQNAASRELIAEKADFVGAIRLPSDAFKREGTSVVTDILFLKKRREGELARHVDADWLKTTPVLIDGRTVPINSYFLNHREMMLGTLSIKDTLHGETGYSLKSNGDLSDQLHAAIERLPRFDSISAPDQSVTESSPFVPPPADKHVTEGSFFVGEDRKIYQIVGGTATPVVYGGTALSANGTMTGKRMAALIGLRDKDRRVLQSQNEAWPEKNRKEVRRDLNRAYDAFVAAYGPINKTTFSESADGNLIRRMPNLAKFREDPDAMLVMALEEYDELTGKAAKAPIMLRDVVGTTPPITTVASAQDGLLVSLDRMGIVDIGYIAQLYGKPESQVIAELGELIFRDPASKEWQTADAYLSGNVREKLKIADAAGPEFARNAAALRAVQPEDVLPGDIDCHLGAPWVPSSDIQAFAADLFSVPTDSIKIAHLERDAVWSVEGDWSTERSVAVTSEFGTARINGLNLLDQALNMKSPTIYDTMPDDSKVVNQEETLAAKEKQKQIKERFKAWVFSDPDRTERLVRLYNDTYNNLRQRHFDGSHLAFPGMTDGITLNPHQVNAVWRGMSGGNTLLAHVVGAGKTFTMAATGMKMKQANLIRKPMYVVPNHMLEQFAREFMQLYPNARLLVASKEDLSRERRKMLTAKIASGEWDGIIITHSSFERIGMSRDYQAEFLREQIAEYDKLLVEHAKAGSSKAGRNIIKTIEKQKASREAKLKDLLAQDKKDDGLVFDELGVDHVFIDEAHYFKNLETPTKMDRVAGIQTGGSERAFDLFMKCRYLDQKHPGHGATFATGTPISNTMVELFTMQRFLDPKGLRDRGIEPFDAWAANFGEVVESMEISPDGASLRPRSRFAKFVNLPELQAMFRNFADVQTAEMLNLPRPTLEGGKPHIVACPMSDEQRQLQGELVERYERLRSQKIDPREDNALNVTTDGRKLALDSRMLSATAQDFPGSKINALVERVTEIWKKSAATRGTQMVFCDMGVRPTKWGFSAYDEIIRKLIEQGIPADQIATVGEADSDAKKQALFERVRQGSVRVLLGSTQKMGTGTNVQRKLVALHHLDAPWKPAEVEQRDGRILRQGNTNAEVAIYRYVTEGSFDAYMWQALENKAKFITQVMTGECALRRAEDIGGQELSYAEVKAIASGNPAVLTLAEADAELQRLAVLRKNHNDEQYLARKNVRDLPAAIDRYRTRLAALEADHATEEAGRQKPLVIADRNFSGEETMAALSAALNRIPDQVQHSKRFPVGKYHELAFGIERHPGGLAEVYLAGQLDRDTQLSRDAQGPRAVLNALHRLADTYGEQIERTRKDLSLAQSQLADYQARNGKPFKESAYCDQLTELRDQLRAALSSNEEGATEASRERAAIIAQLIKQQQSTASANRTHEKLRGNTQGTTDEAKPATNPPVGYRELVTASRMNEHVLA